MDSVELPRNCKIMSICLCRTQVHWTCEKGFGQVVESGKPFYEANRIKNKQYRLDTLGTSGHPIQQREEAAGQGQEGIDQGRPARESREAAGGFGRAREDRCHAEG